MLSTANRLSQPSTNASKGTFERWALIGVLVVWVAMVAAMLSWVALYGFNVPWREDWFMVPALVGKEPHPLEWLWAQTVEHRTPIQRAIYLLLLRTSDGDFRIGMIADVVALGAICIFMLLMARHLRGGKTRLADAFFPLTLLHLGHTEHIFLGYNIQFAISTALIFAWLMIVVGKPWPLSPKIAVTAGLTLVLLPLSGGNGMIFTPVVVLWFAAGAFRYRRDMTTSARWVVAFQIGCICVAIALFCLYFVGYRHETPPNPGILLTIKTAVRLVGMSLGPVGAGTGRIFPQSLIGIFFCVVGCLLWASAVVPLSRGLRSICSAERSRVIGLVMFAAAMGVLILAIAVGRAGWVQLWGGLANRYALLSAPGLCAAYFAWMLYGPDMARDRVGIAFAIAVLFALPFNVRTGLGYRDIYVAGMRAFEQDFAKGLSWQELGERHEKFLMDWNNPAVMKGMQMLQEAQMGPWKVHRSKLSQGARCVFGSVLMRWIISDAADGEDGAEGG